MSSIESKNVRYEIHFAHADGHTVLHHLGHERGWLTGGIDGDVRFWLAKDDEPISFDVGAPVNSIVSHGDKFYVATEENELKCFSLPNGEYKATITRFSAGINCVDISRSYSLLAAGSADFVLKVINLQSNSESVLEGHEAPVLSVAIDPLEKYFVSSSCDGTVRIWGIEENAPVYTIENNHEKSNDFANSKTLCQIRWTSNGDNLVVPGKDGVCVYARGKWNLVRNFQTNGFINASVCCLSECGEYIAAANAIGELVIWKFASVESPIASFVHPKGKSITSLCWNPTKKYNLNFCDTSGELYDLTLTCLETIDGLSYDEIAASIRLDVDDITEEDLIENHNSALTYNSNSTYQPSEMDKEKAPSAILPVGQQMTQSNMVTQPQDEDSDDNEIDIGAIKSYYESKIFGGADDVQVTPAVSQEKVEHVQPVKIVEKPVEVKLQPAFQPGSTPLEYRDRYMVWNEVGIVKQFRSEDENTIDVEFHDTTRHHSIHFDNVNNYTMADLSYEALLCANKGDDSYASSVFCMNFRSWDSKKEWKDEMPKSEKIVALSLGEGFAVVATSQRFVRLYTICGVQLHVISLLGPVVCLAAQGLSFGIVHHTGASFCGENVLSGLFLKLDLESTYVSNITGAISIALSPQSSLSWLGFTDAGTPCTVDSTGVVRLHKKIIGNSWVPIADTRKQVKTKTDHNFVIGVSEICQQVKFVHCKGSRYPSVLPKPVVAFMDFEVPLCEKTTTRGSSEERFLRLKIQQSLLQTLSQQGFDVAFQVEENNSNLSTVLLKMFALALGEGAEYLSLEIANMMPDQTVELAIKYAMQKRKSGLTDRLLEIAQKKKNESLDKEVVSVEDEDEDSVNFTVTKPNAKKINLDALSSKEAPLRPKPLKVGLQKTINPFDISEYRNEIQESETAETEKDSGFTLFMQAKKALIMMENPGANVNLLQVIAAEMFEKLSAEEKQDWNDKAKKRKSDQNASDHNKRQKKSLRDFLTSKS